MIRILLDSSADFSAEEAKKHNLELVPINITMNETNYRDGIDITKDEFYDLLVSSEAFPMTAQPSPQDFLDIFEDAKEKGDQLIYLSLSSGLSGTFQSATLAKSMAEYDEIYLVDTLSATRAIRLMAEYACKLREEGKDAATIAAELENFRSRTEGRTFKQSRSRCWRTRKLKTNHYSNRGRQNRCSRQGARTQ